MSSGAFVTSVSLRDEGLKLMPVKVLQVSRHYLYYIAAAFELPRKSGRGQNLDSLSDAFVMGHVDINVNLSRLSSKANGRTTPKT